MKSSICYSFKKKITLSAGSIHFSKLVVHYEWVQFPLDTHECSLLVKGGFNQYSGESEVLQYFANERHDSVIPDPEIEVVKVKDYTEVWDTELSWHTQSNTRQICH